MLHFRGAIHQYPNQTVRALLLLLALIVSGRAAWGQATTSVRGTVTDPSAKVVVGATVIIANSETKTERTTTTGSQGDYQFLLLPPGNYTLSVTAPGLRESAVSVIFVLSPGASCLLSVTASTKIATP